MTDVPVRRMIRWAKVLDRLDTEDGTAVLVETTHGHRVVRLSATGSAVLDVLDEVGGCADLSTITRALVERLGAPEGVDPETAVGGVVDALVAEHVVVAES